MRLDGGFSVVRPFFYLNLEIRKSPSNNQLNFWIRLDFRWAIVNEPIMDF